MFGYAPWHIVTQCQHSVDSIFFLSIFSKCLPHTMSHYIVCAKRRIKYSTILQIEISYIFIVALNFDSLDLMRLRYRHTPKIERVPKHWLFNIGLFVSSHCNMKPHEHSRFTIASGFSFWNASFQCYNIARQHFTIDPVKNPYSYTFYFLIRSALQRFACSMCQKCALEITVEH